MTRGKMQIFFPICIVRSSMKLAKNFVLCFTNKLKYYSNRNILDL